MKHLIYLFLFFIAISSCNAQNSILASQINNKFDLNERPKLVVGIVVDQMRYDYLTKYADRYGEHGFKKLLNEGFSLTNAHFNHLGTYTAVGHASAYTGTTPSDHGIIGNNWYDKYLKKSIYCVDDSNYNSIGTISNSGKKSPKRMAII